MSLIDLLSIDQLVLDPVEAADFRVFGCRAVTGAGTEYREIRLEQARQETGQTDLLYIVIGLCALVRTTDNRPLHNVNTVSR